MAFLIAVTGFSGAGKTTAVDYLQRLGVGEKVYLGQKVLEEVRARGLVPGPNSEREVRLEFRAEYGPGALAVLVASNVKSFLDQHTNVLVDAIFEDEEYRYLQSCCSENSSSILLAIEASFEIRSRRLLVRAERPCTPEELKIRDDVELEKLGTGGPMRRAPFKITNEGTIQSFENKLSKFWKEISAPRWTV